MPALDDILAQKISLLEGKNQRRRMIATSPLPQARAQRGERRFISFTSNDYLGLSRHPAVMQAAQEALSEYGAGAGASRLAGGNHPLYEALEKTLASYKGREAACVFGSGYLSSIGCIPALVGKGDLIIADRLIHACMHDAAKLSGATMLRFAHNSIGHAHMLLEAYRGEHENCLLLTETVFSMDGDRAPLVELKALASGYDAWLMTDDAHALGVLPPEVSQDADIVMGTLSKAAGSYGGYVCASKAVIEWLHTAARSLIYSTALPPAVLAAAQAAICIMRDDAKLCALPLERARQCAGLLQLDAAQSAIIPVVLGENDTALQAAARLEDEGFLVSAIRPPTVPPGMARLRLAFSALHSTGDVEKLVRAIKGLKPV